VAETGGVWAPSRRALTAGIVASITLSATELLAVATALPAVADELGRTGYGVAISSFAVASVLGVLLGGPAADRLGPARPYLVAVGAFAAGLVIAGSAQNMALFITGRAVQGLGAGAMTPVLYAAIGRGYRDEDSQLRMFSLTSTAWVLPGVAGPGLAGVVTEHLGWRWVFAGMAPFVLVAAVVTGAGLRSVSGSSAGDADAADGAGAGAGARAGDGAGAADGAMGDAGRAPVGVDPTGSGGLGGSGPSRAGDGGSRGAGTGVTVRAPVVPAVAFTVAAAMVLAGSGVSAWPLAVALAAAGLGLGVVAARAGRFLPAGTLRLAPGSPAAVASRFFLLYGFVAVDAFVPLAVTDVRGRSVLVGSLAVTAGTLTWTGGTWTAERLVKRLGPGPILRLGFAVLGIGVVIQMGYVVTAVPLAVALAGTALSGYGTGMAYGLQSALVLGAAPEGEEGQASSSVALADTLAFAAGPAVTGALVALADRGTGSLAGMLAAGWAVSLAACLAGAAASGRAAPAGRLPERDIVEASSV